MERFDKAWMLSALRLALLLTLVSAWNAVPGLGQVPPGENWRTLETTHFRITYPEGLLELAERAGERGERAWSALSGTFAPAPEGRVDLLITDHADLSNGFARVFPTNRIVIYAPPPVDGFGLPYMDEWMELVVTHELVHIFHSDRTRGLTGFFRKVFGRAPMEWPFFPGSASPGWVVEGIATYYESELTQAGRVRGTFHEMVVRTAILEDRFESVDQASGDSPVWPGGQRYYIYGSLFLKYMMDRHDSEAMGRFVEAVAGQWIPYRMDAAAREAFGVSFTEAWRAWKADLESRYSVLRDSLRALAPLTEGEPLTSGGFYAWSPEPSPVGATLAFARSDGRSDPQIRLLDMETGKERKLARTNNLSQFSWTPSGGIVFSQTHLVDSYRSRADLFSIGSGQDKTAAPLTQGARLDHPDVSPAGGKIVAIQEGAGSNRVVLVDPADGSLEPLTAFSLDELWAYPRWSPDGRWIAVSRWKPGARFDLVLLDGEGKVVREVTQDRAIDNAPAWSPDGQWLLWASDQSGIPNLYAVAVAPESGNLGPVRQVTNLLGGGAYPAVGQGNRWIYYSSYHADGWRLERIPFSPEKWFDPFPEDPRFEIDEGFDANPLRFQKRVSGEVGPYDPLPTLRPTYWAPTYREGDQAGDVEVLRPGYGLFTSGRDLVGRHSYSLSGTYAQGAGSFNGQATYTYGGLENPLLGVWAAQTHDASSQPFRGITEDQDTVPLFLVERERSLGVNASFFRYRSRNWASLALSASHIWEDRFLLESDLRESNRFTWSRPSVRSAQLRSDLTFGNARRFSFSISPEDGIGMGIRARVRRDLTVADSLRGVADSDVSFQELVGRFSAYKAFRGPGFGNHVLGVRLSGGVAGGPGANAYHFEVGGASGGPLPLEFVDLGQSLLFPVRGYETARRYGRLAWSGSAEYRFPLALLNRGLGLLPLHLDYVSGSLWFDAGNAWGPDEGVHAFQNPRRDALASTGAELLLRTLPLWFQTVDLRFGVAMPLTKGERAGVYLRLGAAF